ncbi:LamD-like [Gordonia phage Nyceirae]|uniref:LamD-like n=1 Tax=Gordonia phage Nyceirae TaxID=1887651 RepID=A0A1C9EHY7_9CAUD|nr:excisionase and transcriptional regulator [Gordonia phage Nyceirae]AON97401.1 LamD-like [Gordonia phage Nyceirae]
MSLMNDVVGITSSEDPPISTLEAARVLGVVPVTVQRWARQGVIAAEKMPGKTGAYIIRRSELERFRSARADGASQ